jgi:hypothetical protein
MAFDHDPIRRVFKFSEAFFHTLYRVAESPALFFLLPFEDLYCGSQ